MVAVGHAVGFAVANALNAASGTDTDGYGHAILPRTLSIVLDLTPLFCAAPVVMFARGDKVRQAKDGGIHPCRWPQLIAGLGSLQIAWGEGRLCTPQ